MEDNLIRTFICIDFSDEIIKEVARVQESLENIKFTGKLTELENLHLTLKFLGEISLDKVEEVKKRLGEIKFDSFEVKLSKMGVFSKFGNPKIVWIKIDGKEIWELQKKIDESLKDLFKKEERFMSHLTIARIKYVEDRKGFRDYCENISVKKIKMKIDNFKLKSSDLRPIGPVYTTLSEYKLK